MPRFRTIAATAAIVIALGAHPAAALTTPSEGDCAVGVAEIQDEAKREYIDGSVALADSVYSRMPKSFTQMSCLERLMQGGMDIFFSPPSIGDFIGMLENFICDQAENLFAQATAPLNQAFTETADLGGFMPIPGMNRLSAGINTRIRPGMGGESVEDRFRVRGLDRWDRSVDSLYDQGNRARSGLDSLFSAPGGDGRVRMGTPFAAPLQ